MFYITGDTHRNFKCVMDFCFKLRTTVDDTLIILGDAGINYFGGEQDIALKLLLMDLPITLFCVHGNHECRPESISSYMETEWNGGAAYYEPEFPNLLFAKDSEIYRINGYRCITIGGAYSVDKKYRLAKSWHWFSDEQPSPEIKERVENRLEAENWNVDIVFSHTCPLKYEPREKFLRGINQADVDKSTEEWLDKIEDRLTYQHWFCGHYHTEKVVDRLRFMFNDFIAL